MTDPGTVTVGTTATATLTATGVDGPGVGAFTIEVRYDAATVSVSAAGTSGFAVETSTPSAGVLRIVGYMDARTGPIGDVSLASLSITGEQPGDTDIRVAVETFADANGDDIGYLTEPTVLSVGGGGSSSESNSRSSGGSGNVAPPVDTASVRTSLVDGRVAVDISDARPGEAVTVSLPEPVGNGDVGLSELRVTLSGGGAGSLSVASPSKTPPEASSLDVDGGALSYFDVAHDFDDSLLGGVDFSLTVSKTRLDARGLTPTDLRLYRYHDGTWQALPTRVVGETGTDIELVATSPGLSVFALAAGPSAASLGVTGVSVGASEVSPGESVTVVATVENVGGQSGMLAVDLRVDGEQRINRSVQLGAGESRTVEFVVVFDEPGRYDIAVAGVAGESVSVSEPPGSATPSSDGAVTTSPGASPGTFPNTSVLGTLVVIVGAVLLAVWVAQRRGDGQN
ncbi:PGF-pre-PGF domain-containing protein [Halobellus sp. EA9]|uniref:PGF-pre-PGF domain-containing protein n=1 Tax=Halobellus sp. EA9 TaxID=3421647 RepID=UPI003EB9DE1D